MSDTPPQQPDDMRRACELLRQLIAVPHELPSPAEYEAAAFLREHERGR